MNKLLVLLGASENGVLAGKKLGFKVIVVVPKSIIISAKITEHVDEIITVNSLENESDVYEKIKNIINGKKIALILSFTEKGLKTAAILSKKLNLPTNDPETIVFTRDKSLMRKKFLKSDILKINYKSGDTNDFNPEELPINTPFIIKPIDGYGSMNVSFINNQNMWTEWYHKNKINTTKWIIEPYIEGPEYSIETISSNGEHYIIGITAKDTTGKPNFIETGHSVPAMINQQLYDQIVFFTKEALSLMNIKYGPSHIEVKWDNKTKQLVIIEMHTRPGGDFIPFLHYLSTGIDQYEVGILSYYNKSIIKLPFPENIQYSSVKFLTFPQGTLLNIGFLNEILDENIQEWNIYYNIGEKINKTIDSYSRAGHIIVSSDSKDNNENSVKNFMSNLFFKIH